MDANTLTSHLHTRTTHVVTLGGAGAAMLTFDLASVSMTPEQEVVVRKLFSQRPVLIATEGPHSARDETNKPGPASQYLTPAEFECIRKLGVRLGTQGVLAATACDFCLHCVKLEALPLAGPLQNG